MTKKTISWLAVIACLGLGPTFVAAELVTSDASIPGPNYVINFSQFTIKYSTPGAPVQVGTLVGKNVTMENCNEYGNFDFSLGYTFWTPQNGYWRGPAYTSPGLYFTCSYNPPNMILFRFQDGPVRGVGAFVNYDPFMSPQPTITALGKNGEVLEEYNLAALAPISTPSQENQGGFRGIVRNQADIYAFKYSQGYLVLTNLTFSEPTPQAAEISGPRSLLLD